jgi:hypothetical protein
MNACYGTPFAYKGLGLDCALPRGRQIYWAEAQYMEARPGMCAGAAGFVDC